MLPKEPSIFMPTHDITLTQEQDAFVRHLVESGEYQDASEAVRDALRALRYRREADALKLEALRTQIQAGADALAHGDYTEVAHEGLATWLEGLTDGNG